MKYNLKTAVHVTDEFTRENIIEFFEAIKSDCNKEFNLNINYILIGRVHYIDEFGNLEGWGLTDFKIEYPDYTIIEGIPENWREEMGDIDTQSKINQLESENKELRECLSDYIYLSELYCKISESNYTIQLDKVIKQAKQLLNK